MMKGWQAMRQEFLADDSLLRKKISHRVWNGLAAVFRALLLFGMCFVLLYPILYMLSMAFRPTSEIYDPSVIWVPKSLTLTNITEAMRLMKYSAVLGNSLRINVFSSLLQAMTCAFTGYGFARFQFPGKKIFFAVVIFTIVIPSQLTIIPLSRNLNEFNLFGLSYIGLLFGQNWTVNLIDTPFSFFIPALFAAGIKAGLLVFIFRQFFRGLPKELEDAAAIDGCGFFKTFIRVILPNAASVCLTVVILSVVWYWNDYYYSSMFVPNYGTVSLALTGLSGSYAMEHSMVNAFDIVTLMQAGALLALAPLLLMYVILQRWFIQGVERSGLVG